jgi:ATP-dependent exoDNAse (exonuclease V) alpha subunit
LCYVAATRAKHSLFLIEEDGFEAVVEKAA